MLLVGLMIGKRVQYRGDVQGVGFRMTARRVAQGFSVTGYVKNLEDGAVELVAIGAADEIDRFLGAIRSRMAGYIREEDIQDEPPHSFPSFEIRI
jgi:acylphosphatase